MLFLGIYSKFVSNTNKYSAMDDASMEMGAVSSDDRRPIIKNEAFSLGEDNGAFSDSIMNECDEDDYGICNPKGDKVSKSDVFKFSSSKSIHNAPCARRTQW